MSKRSTDLEGRFNAASALGVRMPNGAIIVAARPTDVDGWLTILAIKDGEYIVWNLGPEDQLQSGSYFSDEEFDMAVMEYEDRP